MWRRLVILLIDVTNEPFPEQKVCSDAKLGPFLNSIAESHNMYFANIVYVYSIVKKKKKTLLRKILY